MRIKFLATDTVKCLFTITMINIYIYIYCFSLLLIMEIKKSFLVNLTILGFAIAYL